MGAKFGHSPLRTVIDAIHSSGGLHPENALRVLAWYEDLPELVEAMAQMFRQHGQALTDEFYMDPSAAEYARTLGEHFARFHEPAQVAATTFYNAHRDDIKKLLEPQPHQEKWDIGANRA